MCDILEIVKIELESRDIDLFVLGTVISLIGMALLLFVGGVWVFLQSHPRVVRLRECIGDKAYAFVGEFIMWTAVVLMAVGLATLPY